MKEFKISNYNNILKRMDRENFIGLQTFCSSLIVECGDLYNSDVIEIATFVYNKLGVESDKDIFCINEVQIEMLIKFINNYYCI